MPSASTRVRGLTYGRVTETPSPVCIVSRGRAWSFHGDRGDAGRRETCAADTASGATARSAGLRLQMLSPRLPARRPESARTASRAHGSGRSEPAIWWGPRCSPPGAIPDGAYQFAGRGCAWGGRPVGVPRGTRAPARAELQRLAWTPWTPLAPGGRRRGQRRRTSRPPGNAGGGKSQGSLPFRWRPLRLDAPGCACASAPATRRETCPAGEGGPTRFKVPLAPRRAGRDCLGRSRPRALGGAACAHEASAGRRRRRMSESDTARRSPRSTCARPTVVEGRLQRLYTTLTRRAGGSSSVRPGSRREAVMRGRRFEQSGLLVHPGESCARPRSCPQRLQPRRSGGPYPGCRPRPRRARRWRDLGCGRAVGGGG